MESKVKLRDEKYSTKKKKKGKTKSICQRWQTFRILREYKYILLIWFSEQSLCTCGLTGDGRLLHSEAQTARWVCMKSVSVRLGFGVQRAGHVSAGICTWIHSNTALGAAVQPQRLSQTHRCYTWLEPCPPDHWSFLLLIYIVTTKSFPTWLTSIFSSSSELRFFLSSATSHLRPYWFASGRNSSVSSLYWLFVPIYSLYKCTHGFLNPAISFFSPPPSPFPPYVAQSELWVKVVVKSLVEGGEQFNCRTCSQTRSARFSNLSRSPSHLFFIFYSHEFGLISW